MPILSVVLLGGDETPQDHSESSPVKDKENQEMKEINHSRSSSYSNDPPSHYDIMIHPNFEEENSQNAGQGKKKKKTRG